MKSVKKVFKKKLSPYNLRSRKSAVPVVKANTPKVNREVQASLSEEENCTLLCELPYYRSSVHESTHAIDLHEEIQPSKPSDGPRLSTAFSSPSQANSTNREAINISIERHQEPSIVQPSSSKQSTPCGPRVVSDSSSLEDFTPLDSRHLQSGRQIALEVDEISEPEHREPDPEQNSSFAHDLNPLINSQLTCHSQVRDRDSINYKKSKQNKTDIRLGSSFSFSSDEIGSEGSKNTSTSSSREDSEEEGSRTPVNTDPGEVMDPHLIQTLTEALQRIGQQQQTSIVVPETIRIQPFRGLDGDDVVEWFEVFENRLKRRRIALESESALTELVLHLAGPAKDFYSDLTPDEKDTLEHVKRIMIEHYSSKDHGYGQREYLLNRRQAPSETLDHYLTDICTKFRRLGLTNKEKMTYFLQGLRPDIRQLVYMKEPKSFAEAEKAARFAESISRAPQPSTTGITTEHELVAKLLDQKAVKDGDAILSKLDVLINGQNTKTENDQIQSLVSRLNGLIDKATSQQTAPNPETKSASLTAYAEPNRKETPDYMREIRRMEDKLEDLYRRMDRNPEEQQLQSLLSKFEELLARPVRKFDDSHSRGENTTSIAAFSEASNKQTPELLKEIRRIENSFTERLENLNQRVIRLDRLARRNRTVCYRCGRTGHIQYNCYHYYQPESPCQNQEESQEFLAHYNQEESQRLPTNPSARLSALDAQFPRRVLNYHVNKANSSGSVEQTSRQQVRTSNLAFEGEENSPEHVLAFLPKQEKVNSQGKVSSNTQSHQDVKLIGSNKRQPQFSHKQVSSVCPQ